MNFRGVISEDFFRRPGDSVKKVKKIVEAFVLRPKIAAAVETTADRRNAGDMSSREAFCAAGMRSIQLLK
ncbi:hypothetical protein DY000_02020619 [Brassica cretica]|uniref:Uncharacterized protein n=1 Tax=Brassica cretica TaxID=69181 RepID=A0ABQ7E6B0_BRACR|nr:hypothetical protein DY000_02020619 [Brassica cretica]